VDESGFDRYPYRRFGYGLIGCIVQKLVHSDRPTRISTIGIRNSEHKIASSMIYEGTAGSLTILAFFKAHLHEYPKGSVFVFDNARVHKGQELQDLFREYGCIIKFLPAYSPDLNPIEKLWGSIKRWLKAYYVEALGFQENVIRAINWYSVGGREMVSVISG
jgi:transposase